MGMIAVSPLAGKKRLVWATLIFLGGLLCGLPLGIFGFRYAPFLFRPPMNQMIHETALRIQREFNLDAPTRTEIEVELLFMDRNFHAKVSETHHSLENIMADYVEKIARFLPDDAARKRWRAEYRDYFPLLPPKPPEKP